MDERGNEGVWRAREAGLHRERERERWRNRGVNRGSDCFTFLTTISAG